MAIVLRRNADDLDAWHLDGVAEMAAALDALTVHGYRGALSQEESGGWKLELNRAVDTPIIAGVGDWLVWDMGLRHITGGGGDTPAGYHTAGGV